MSITQRWPHEVTRRYLTEGGLAANAQLLGASTWVAGRYRIESGPLGAGSGEGEVFRAWDATTEQEVALKLYRLRVAPKPEVIQRLRGLHHPHLVTLLDAGAWEGRFYEAMLFCAGGNLAEHAPFTPSQLAQYLPGIAQALRACHQQGIIHRDIKPANLYFRDAARTQVMLGDFGISSVLDSPTGQTQSHAALTLDYAAPELLEQATISPKTDYYALGISLAALLLGRSPFQGLTQAAILAAHLRNRIPLPPEVPPQWRILLQGLTQLLPAARWGDAQLTAWLRGEPVLDAGGNPWVGGDFSQRRPYPGYPAATTPQQLAQHLEQFDALSQLQRGDIRRWVFDHYGAELAEAIAALEPLAQRQPQLALRKLRFLLDPSASLTVAGVTVRTLADLAKVLRNTRPETQTLWAQMFWDGLLDAWISHNKITPRHQELTAQMQAIRQRLHREQDRTRALLALRYLLDPARPPRLTPVHPLPKLNALEVLLSNKLELHQAFTQLLVRGELEEWLQATQPHAEALLAFVRQARVDYLDQPSLAAYVIRWHLDPRAEFPFRGQVIRHARDLAAAIDADLAATAHGVELLRRGWIRAWLVHTRRLADFTELDRLLAQDQPWEAKLETLLHLLDPKLPWPKLAVAPEQYQLGVLEDRTALTLTIQNLGRGYLHGIAQAQSPDVVLDELVFRGGNKTLRCRIAPERARQPGAQRTGITLRSNGGAVFVPIRYRVTLAEDPWWSPRELEPRDDLIVIIVIWVIALVSALIHRL